MHLNLLNRLSNFDLLKLWRLLILNPTYYLKSYHGCFTLNPFLLNARNDTFSITDKKKLDVLLTKKPLIEPNSAFIYIYNALIVYYHVQSFNTGPNEKRQDSKNEKRKKLCLRNHCIALNKRGR